MQITIIPDSTSFDAARQRLELIPGGIRKAGKNAANKTISWAKTRVARGLAEVVDAQKSKIAKHLYVKKANNENMEALLRVKSKAPNLIAFHARQTSTGVTAKIKSVPHAFIATGLSGNKLVFIRLDVKKIMKQGRYAGKKRSVIAGVPGMTAAELYRHVPALANKIGNELPIEFKKQLESQIDYILNKGNTPEE